MIKENIGKIRKMKKTKYVVSGIIAAVLIAAAAFALVNVNKPQSTYTTATSSVKTVGLQIGSVAPDFFLIDPINGKITKQSFQGKPLFIFFTTTWCTPCQLGAQNLAKYDDEKGGDGFNVLIVFVDDKESDPQFIEWKNKFGRDDWYVAKGIEMAKTYQVQYLDTKYVFDREGKIQWVDVRPLEYRFIAPVMDRLLGA
jgi:thiol-disulfide isomerase/thioredoxin